jgi:tight adherence protein C
MNFPDSFHKKYKDHIETLLYRSGKGGLQTEPWIAKRWQSIKILFLLGLLLSIITNAWVFLFLFLMYGLWLSQVMLADIRNRKDRILKRIPFVMNMLILNLESGLDFITALEELIAMDDQHPLHQEIKLTLKSIHLGETRAKAFANMAKRADLTELNGLAGIIEQSENMGSSLTELLRLQSSELQHRLFKQAEAKAQKTPVKILIPMMMFIFPVVFILLFAPIALQLMGAFQ